MSQPVPSVVMNNKSCFHSRVMTPCYGIFTCLCFKECGCLHLPG